MPKGSSSRIGGASIIAWLERNDATVLTGSPHGREAWHKYLVKIVGSDGSVAGLEKQWLRIRIVALSGTVPGQNHSDLWGTYLSLKGFTGNIGDKIRSWLDSGTA